MRVSGRRRRPEGSVGAIKSCKTDDDQEYWDNRIELEYTYRLNTFFATEPPASWFDSDEDFAADMERERVRYEAAEVARREREERGRVQPLPPQPQQAAEEVDGDDAGSDDWPSTPEWDPGHMQRAIEADIPSTAS